MRCRMDHQSPCTSVTDEDEVEALYATRLHPTFTSSSSAGLRPRMCIPASNHHQHPAYRDYPCCSTDDPRQYRIPSHSNINKCETYNGFVERRPNLVACYPEHHNTNPYNSRNQYCDRYSGAEVIKDSYYICSPEERFFTIAADVHSYNSSDNRNTKTGARKKLLQYNKGIKSKLTDKVINPKHDSINDMDEIETQFTGLSTADNEINMTRPAWNRNNIAATMERFEPLEYSYVYNEPKMVRGHQTVPDTTKKKSCCHDTKPRSHTKRSSKGSLTKQSCKSRNAREENPYEEISDESVSSCPKHRNLQQRSLISLNQSMMEEEVRRVEDKHKRILGELNLSVEAMLMPDSDSTDSEQADDSKNVEDSSVGPTDDLLSPSSFNPLTDLDSGFSGSSSGASYIGSLRLKCGLQRTRSSLSFPRSSTPLATNSLCRNYPGQVFKGPKRDERYENPISIERGSQKSPNHSTSSRNTSDGDNSSKSSSFWSKKSWRKMSGFSSSGAINKVGLSDLLVKYTFRRKPHSTSTDSGSPRTITCETCLKQRC